MTDNLTLKLFLLILEGLLLPLLVSEREATSTHP